MSAEVTLGWNNAKLAAGARQASSIVDSTTAKMRGAFAGLAATGGAFLGVREIVEATVKYDSLRLGMVSLTGSVEAANDRLDDMRKLAKEPGLGFEQVVEMDLQLRSAGLSAQLSTDAMREFGNALAIVGKGKAELDGIALGLTKIVGNGKVTAEAINMIAERLPQIRNVMKSAFGTADTEALQKMGISAEEFISKTVKEMEKGARAIVGMQGKWDNLTDVMTSRLADIGNGIADGLLGPLENATEKIEDSKVQAEAFGKALGGLASGVFLLGDGLMWALDGVGNLMTAHANFTGNIIARYIPAVAVWKQEVKEFNEAQMIAAADAKVAEDAFKRLTAVGKARADVEATLAKLINERAEADAKATRAMIDSTKAAEESFRAQFKKTQESRLTDEEKLEKIKEHILQIDRELNAVIGQPGGTEIALKLNEERLRATEELDRLAKSIQKTNEETNRVESERLTKIADEVVAKEQAMQLFALELAIAEAASRGQDAKVAKLERERDIIETTVRLMNELGVGYAEAVRLAERLTNAEKSAEDRKKGGDGERSKIFGYSRDRQGDAASAQLRATEARDFKTRQANTRFEVGTGLEGGRFDAFGEGQRARFGQAFGNAPAAEQAIKQPDSGLSQIMAALDKWAANTTETFERAFQ